MNETPNGIVASNLHEARRRRGLTQEQAAERLAPHGIQWSPASFSAAERGRKHFTIDEIHTFSQAFDLPVVFFLIPPRDADTVGTEGSEPVHVADFLESVFDVGDEDTREHLRSATLSRFSLEDARGVVERYAESWRGVGSGAGGQRIDEALRREALVHDAEVDAVAKRHGGDSDIEVSPLDPDQPAPFSFEDEDGDA